MSIKVSFSPELEPDEEAAAGNTKKKKAASKKSYAEWIRDNGILTDEIYDSSIRNAVIDYMKAKSEYGTRAEGLAKTGLSSGGYSDYLSGKAYTALQQTKRAAASEYYSNERKNRLGYSSYLESLENAESELYGKVSDAIAEKQLAKYEDAYEYAVRAGLSEKMAESAAGSATKIAAENIKRDIMKLVLNNKLSYKETKSYAVFMGLSEEDAEWLSQFAKSHNYLAFDSGSSYLDYINEQTKGNTEK